jgi:hypothetical protein
VCIGAADVTIEILGVIVGLRLGPPIATASHMPAKKKKEWSGGGRRMLLSLGDQKALRAANASAVTSDDEGAAPETSVPDIHSADTRGSAPLAAMAVESGIRTH